MLNTSMFLSRRSLILEISHWIDDFSRTFTVLVRLDNWNKNKQQIVRHPIEIIIAITFWSLFNFVLFFKWVLTPSVCDVACLLQS